jgi:hypothetical protein
MQNGRISHLCVDACAMDLLSILFYACAYGLVVKHVLMYAKYACVLCTLFYSYGGMCRTACSSQCDQKTDLMEETR